MTRARSSGDSRSSAAGFTITALRSRSAGGARSDGRLDHAFDGVDLFTQRGDVASVRGEVERRALIGGTGDEDASVGRWLQRANEDVVGAESPVLGPSQLFDQLDPPA